ncbi:type II toxin-antitoxin system prevent-host-death family antitoxin [Methylibium sp.]|uniref:type II toxin-antitoxin system Phd/YefM family antitoxin n=1 Tax=Methylibium sp. TaxID=2067992 RepID=UPI00286AE28B|nr:type II toxin-antitoxin system prevent-host-death family antitoxin [Methylibium sp.]
MRTTGIFEAKQSFSELIAAVEAGEEVRITRHGKEVVRMLPVRPSVPQVSAAQIERELKELRQLRARVRPGPGWRELRDEGRRF